MNDDEKKWSKELDETAANIQKELDSDEYKFYSEKNGCKVYQKATSPTIRWKSTIEMNFPAKKIMDTFISEDMKVKKAYDVDVCEKYDFKKVDKETHFNLTYAKYSTPTFVSNRDFVYCSKIYETEKVMYIICRSINVDGFKEPNETGCVRASLIYILFYIEKISDEKSYVTYFTQTEPGGWMPTWAFNQLTENQAYLPMRLAKFLEDSK
eukprot:gene5600-9417_t